MMAGTMIWSNIQQAAVFSVLQAEFLALAATSSLQYPAVYLITDIENGLYVQTLTDSTYSNEAILSFLAPDYALHAQYHSSDGAVANGATVTWGGFYWTNNTGGAVTPDLPDNFDIDSDLTGWTKVSKSVANGYNQIQLSAMIATVGSNIIVSVIKDKWANSYNSFISVTNADFDYEGIGWLNNEVPPNQNQNSLVFCINNRVSDASLISNNSKNLGIIKRCLIEDGGGMCNNLFSGVTDIYSSIENCVVSNDSTLSDNKLYDSRFKDCNIIGSFCNVEHNVLTKCNIENLTLNSSSQKFIVNTFTFEDTVTFDFTGWVRDVVGVTIQSGSGWFTITHDFSTSPLNSGSSVFYNLIPSGARITSIQAIGTSLTGGGGATLAFGLETDAPTLIAADTLANVNAGKTYAGFSTPATANRSLVITAGVNNVTGGTVTVKVEFIL